MVYIRERNELFFRPGIEEIAGQIDAPRAFLAKILQRLVRAGLMNSLKGKSGGFFMTEAQSKVLIRDVILFLNGSKILSGCGFGLKSCDSSNPCPLHHQYEPIRSALSELVESETIQSLSNKPGSFLK